jgi:hypothetical protein
MDNTVASLPLEVSALSLRPRISTAAASDSEEGSEQDTTLASLPVDILALIHSCVLQADPSLRSCLALEATCQHVRSTLLSNSRFDEVSVDAWLLCTAQDNDSFWSWIAANGRRTDKLLLQCLELDASTPTLYS